MLEIINIFEQIDELEEVFKNKILMKTKKTSNDKLEYEIAEEAFKVLDKGRRSFSSQDSGFESNASSDSEECSYPEKLNPTIKDYDSVTQIVKKSVTQLNF